MIPKCIVCGNESTFDSPAELCTAHWQLWWSGNLEIENRILVSTTENKSLQLALESHGEQRYGDSPYVFHLMEVKMTLDIFGFTDPVISAAAYLHDALEDTSCTPQQIRDVCGEEVLTLVEAVTGRGDNRKKRNADIIAKICKLPKAEQMRATAIKVADRIANVEHCWETRDRRLFMYFKEHPHFFDALYAADEVELQPMWERLNKLLDWQQKR